LPVRPPRPHPLKLKCTPLTIEDCLEDIDAVPVLGYNVIYNADPVHIPYPPLPWDRRRRRAQGRSFHHGRFVQKLREAARRTSGVTVVEATVVDLVREAGRHGGRVVGVECKASGGAEREFVRTLLNNETGG
jgi:squalene monooxygenase